MIILLTWIWPRHAHPNGLIVCPFWDRNVHRNDVEICWTVESGKVDQSIKSFKHQNTSRSPEGQATNHLWTQANMSPDTCQQSDMVATLGGDQNTSAIIQSKFCGPASIREGGSETMPKQWMVPKVIAGWIGFEWVDPSPRWWICHMYPQ